MPNGNDYRNLSKKSEDYMAHAINEEGITLLKNSEGFRKVAYQDIGGIWTIGYGFTKGVKKDDTITKAQAEKRLKLEVAEFADGILNLCTVVPNENQLAALVVFAYNIGLEGFSKSTVLRCHNKGNTSGAIKGFGMWNKVKGNVVNGLTLRRAAEAALYAKSVDVVAPSDVEMPQKVDEPKLLSSKTVSASTITAGTSAVALITQTTSSINQAKESTKTLFGEYFPSAAFVLIIVVCGYLIWNKFHGNE
jgi:lysozyme